MIEPYCAECERLWNAAISEPDLIADAALLVDRLDDMRESIGADHVFEDGALSPSMLRYRVRLGRILAKAERRLQRREFAEMRSAR